MVEKKTEKKLTPYGKCVRKKQKEGRTFKESQRACNELKQK